jgi:hypothetical protein
VKKGVLEVDEEGWNGQRQEKGSVKNRRRLRGVLVVEAERWRLERENIRDTEIDLRTSPYLCDI